MPDLPATIKKTYLVEKQNIFNQMKSSELTFPEMRLLTVYLAKINAREPSTRKVRFPVEDFKKIMGLQKLEPHDLAKSIENLFRKTVYVPIPGGADGYGYVHLFDRVDVKKDDDGEWHVDLTAHEEAMPLIFNFKDRYFAYELWNVIGLKSTNQIRMYELMKEHAFRGSWVVDVKDLREFVGIAKDDYTEYSDFRKRVLDSCQEALRENTNVKFAYSVHKRVGKGGAVKSLLFKIEKNRDYKDPLNMDELLEMNGIREENLLVEGLCAGVSLEDLERRNFLDDILNIKKTVEKSLDKRAKGFKEKEFSEIRGILRVYFKEDFGDIRSDPAPLGFKHMDYLKALCGKVASRGNAIRDPYGYLKFYFDMDLLEKYGSRPAVMVLGYRPGDKAMLEHEIKRNELAAARAAALAAGADPSKAGVKKNRFANFDQRKNDYAEWERLELEQQLEEYGGAMDNPVPKQPQPGEDGYPEWLRKNDYDEWEKFELERQMAKHSARRQDNPAPKEPQAAEGAGPAGQRKGGFSKQELQMQRMEMEGYGG